mmetsp:Transcript_47950/g.102667  ORF Transcript_47950/g.102667 Transcript_47950/m.102667 type:complete len:277 (-) Transcript_47950:68-898(-)
MTTGVPGVDIVAGYVFDDVASEQLFIQLFVAQVVGLLVCWFITKLCWPNHKDYWSMADSLISLVIFPILSFCSLATVWHLHETVESRWRGSWPIGRFNLTLYCARQMMHMPVQCLQKMPKKHLMLMTIHHIMSLICFGNGLLVGREEFWACLASTCEISTVFLTNLCLLKEVTVGGRELKDVLPAWVNAVNGFSLWMAFLVFRLMLFPFWLYHRYVDIVQFPKVWEEATWLERYLYPAVIILLLVLSTIWFIPLTKGMLKAVGKMKAGSGGEKKAE